MMPTSTATQPAATQPAVLVERQVADQLVVSLGMFKKMRREGTFPQGVQLGKRCMRWPADAVTKWMAQHAT